MNLHIKGAAFNIEEPIVGLIGNINGKDDLLITYNNEPKCIITHTKKNTKFPYVVIPEYSLQCNEADIVVATKEGMLNVVYRHDSIYNSLLVSEQCNNNCLMCSQPPKIRDNMQSLFSLNEQIIPLIPKDCRCLGITGGEPTLLGDRFFKLLEHLKLHLPETDIQILTNGRVFSSLDYANMLTRYYSENMVFGIPLYSDYAPIHDYIVQSHNAFNETILGLYNLAKYNLRIELRVVLHKISVKRLVQLSHFIYHNLPFVEHVAFMGLENAGYTKSNRELLWIDPVEYMEQLKNAVIYLDRMGLNVSLYNLQLCLLPDELQEFSCRAISDWKNIYLEECSGCVVKNNCGGFFASNRNLFSKYIKSIKVPYNETNIT